VANSRLVTTADSSTDGSDRSLAAGLDRTNPHNAVKLDMTGANLNVDGGSNF
jgi:hypothetical protein